MANIKTAISIQKSLFEQAESLARELKVSRSRLYALAVEEFIRRYQNEQLLERINRAYPDEPDRAERESLRRRRRSHRRMVEGTW